MSEEIWHYEKDGNSQGPVTEDRMIELINSGEVQRDTLVWRHPLEHWVTAHEVKVFKPLFVRMPPPLPGDSVQGTSPPEFSPFSPPDSSPDAEEPLKVSRDLHQGNIPIPQQSPPPQTPIWHEPHREMIHQRLHDNPEIDGVSQVRPWVRFFARMLDYTIFGILVTIIALLTIIDVADIIAFELFQFIYISIFIHFIWVFIEAYLLSAYGTTPGKYVFGTSVVDGKGHKTSYENALGRSVRVWVKGVALMLPVAYIIAMIFGYINLEKDKRSSWDRDAESTVLHKSFNVLSPIFSYLIAIVLFFIVIAYSVS